ncbi:uncharacterized protein K460DRAFT_405594 [Cucurbitaria berberidis CBS 394.84]|uniref:DUF7730 domain-containing protein n=1 Tax=Cucurbitaria berberidis CBS 394.84 TaxID=1168544 RepID=A0A9P4L8K6_9PLEO|nr:uncharacterized protein K460DRAFT_405594 [Cucurbitaria berberidis CBS 394.84]KAF1845329.1 hypothetical protein K460DRAFT_405594 [Cucurbitaria berberidis CBS 394.84]
MLPKRLKTEEAEDNVSEEHTLSGPSTTRPRNSLLTPEPTRLTESQVAPSDEQISGPTQTFPFMKLPAELRIHVYHVALHRAEPILLHADRAPEQHDDEDGHATTPCPTAHTHTPHCGTVIRPEPRMTLGPEHMPGKDPIVPEILRLNKLIYREARQVLYSDNVFTLSLASGIYTLSALHQRSRSLIKHVVLTIPSHHDILDGFADLVRLGLRYCWGLKSFKIILRASLPDDGGRVSGATSVYANAFHILRWLPRGCKVVLEGCVSDSVMRVVREEGRLMSVLDETSYLKRQHQMPERH